VTDVPDGGAAQHAPSRRRSATSADEPLREGRISEGFPARTVMHATYAVSAWRRGFTWRPTPPYCDQLHEESNN
jgi:hypothetical protein